MAFLDWWVPDAPLEPDEVEQLAIPANHTVSRWRAVGGKLIATSQRLVFRPHRFDRAFGGRVWSVPLASIRAVGRKPPTFNPFDGGIRSRLCITTDDGEHLFVINRLAAQIARIDALR
jgi:hypothetical protein